MSSPVPPADAPAPDRIPGFLYTCRLAPDGTFIFDAPPGDLERLLELSPADVSGMLSAGRLPVTPDAGPELWAAVRESADRLTGGSRDLRVVTPRSGREVWVRVHGVPRREPDGTVEWSGLVLDVTDLKSAESRLRDTVGELARSEARMRAALDGAKMLGWDLDLVANRWETTADLTEFYGVPRGPDYTDPQVALTAIHPDDVPAVLAGRRQAVETGGPMRYEFRGRLPTPDGSPRWFSTSGRVLRDDAGKATRIVAVTTDISERKRAEAERESLNRQLLDAQKWESLGVLAGGVAHDFNNILTVILGSAGLARKGLPPFNPAGGYLDQIEQACRRAADLCRQLLAYAGRGQAAAGKTDLNQLIRSSSALLALPGAKSAAVRFNLADGLPPVVADAAPVRQVLVNLVMNAAEALGDSEGVVTVRTQLVEVGPDPTAGYHLSPAAGKYVRLTVTDTGPGITPDVRARMFDPFFTTKFAGRGLGLSAVLGIMRAHQGAIRVSTELSRGTTVETLWPVTGVEPTPLAERPHAGKALVVDDEMYVREVTASTLQELGYEPLLAGDAPTALSLFRDNRETVRVAVLDVVMPGMTGDQLLRELRAIDPALPAVLVSGFTDRRVIKEATGTGVGTEFLQKPFHPEELIAVVRRVLGR
jgi:two-component system, cell cycle sensor histidine kinase and response regulator CckA